MRGLLIAEKPSVMRAIKGEYEKIKPGSFPDQLEFDAFHGHLMELKAPEDYDPCYADWKDTAMLPISPRQFGYKPSDPKSVRELSTRIQNGKFDFLINACDAGREGEHIFWSFYETVGLKLPVKRFWASSVTAAAIRKALFDLKDSCIYEGLRQAAKYRAQFDWLVGMNLTRAATSRLKALTPIGRVQTPTLKVIVDRELAIRDFKPEDFFEVKADFSVNGGTAPCVHLIAPDHKGTRFKSQTDADKIADEVRRLGKGQVVATKNTVVETNAPTLLSLTELQRAANKLLKLTPEKTLAIAQKLYEGGLLTYPRTESRYLPTDLVPEIPEHLAVLATVPELGKFAAGIGKPEIDNMLSKKYVDDAGITDHHAIIPTDQTPNWGSLSTDEQAVYTLVGKSFLAIFMPPHRSASSVVLVSVGTHLFKGQGRVELDPGYTVLYPSRKSAAKALPPCQKGDWAVLAKAAVIQGTTKPPPRFTPDSVLNAMENAGQDLPDSMMRSILRESAGLGTPATRADILLKLQKRDYIALRSNAYFALEKGIELIRNIGDRSFASAVLTAQWEAKLSSVEEQGYQGNFRGEMDAYVRAETMYLLTSLAEVSDTVGVCPFCGGKVREVKAGFVCENYHKADAGSCELWISKNLAGKTMCRSEVEALLKGETIGPFEFTHDGKKWRADLVLTRDKGVALLNDPEVVCKCPVCGADVVSANKGFVCVKRKKTDPQNCCTFWMPKTVGEYDLTQADINALVAGQLTTEKVIKTKSGHDWRVSFYLDEAKAFQIKNLEQHGEVGKCPVCHKEVYASNSNFYCSGYQDRSCSWSMSRTVKGATLTDKDMKAMLAGGRTRSIRFIWSSGKEGTAQLYLENGRLKWVFPN